MCFALCRNFPYYLIELLKFSLVRALQIRLNNIHEQVCCRYYPKSCQRRIKSVFVILLHGLIKIYSDKLAISHHQLHYFENKQDAVHSSCMSPVGCQFCFIITLNSAGPLSPLLPFSGHNFVFLHILFASQAPGEKISSQSA